jgi:acetyl-CoA carboxylase carboxyl transferase subunit alpha
VLIFENAYYSVISPEGCAAILWKDRASAPRAAEALKIDPPNLKRLEIVDEIIEEPFGGNHNDYDVAADNLRAAIARHLDELRPLSIDELLSKRYERFRALGVMETRVPAPATSGAGAR